MIWLILNFECGRFGEVCLIILVKMPKIGKGNRFDEIFYFLLFNCHLFLRNVEIVRCPWAH